MKNKLFVFINTIGLGTALACCIVTYLNWDYNTQFDTYHAGTENVYRVNFIRTINGENIKNGSCPFPLAEQISSSSSQLEKAIRYLPISGNFRLGDEVFRTDLAAVDPSFFEVFNFPMLSGSSNDRLKDKQSILISETLRLKHFPDNDNPVGAVLTFIDGDKRLDYQVAGVFAIPPKNTSFSSDAYIQYDHATDVEELDANDWALFNSTFVTINNTADVSEVERQLQAYVDIQNKAKQDYKVAEFYLDPFEGMAVRSEREDIWNHWFRQSLPTSAATAPGIMAFLILLIACFNFTNTSIAIANRRIKEIGIRKVLGSTKKQLIAQFFSENIMLVCIAMFIGVILAFFLVPAYSAMWPFLDIQLNLFDNFGLLAFLGLLVLFTALLAGSYPAFYVSSFEPITILRGKVKFSGTNTLTRILLTMQFAISLLAIISGFVFSQNANYQATYDMGFDMDNIVYAYVQNEQGYTKMRNELMAYDKVKEIAGSRHSISSSWYTDPIKYESSEMDVSIFDVGAGYLSAVGASLVAGRDFMENSQQDQETAVIINQELARAMDWDNALDKRIVLRDTVALNVIGVVKDIFYKGGLWDPLEPMLLRYAPQTEYRFLTVKTEAENLLAVKELMDEKWQTAFPDELSTVRFMDEEKASMSLVNTNIKVLFIFLGIVAVLLSVIGLFSLVSLNLIKRMKEIGVRKIFGASVQNISLKVSKEFIIILFIASILGSVGAYFLTDLLMSSIWAYHVPQQLLPFIASIVILFLASGITISGKVFRAATMNPADILNDE